MDYSSKSEKILRSIENIVKSDPDLEDFTIIPTEANTQNKTPVLYEEHHLGLESWCIKYVYQYICSELFNVRKSLAQLKMVRSKRENLNYLLMGGLFINPDVATFWNMRRELLEVDTLNYEQELKFSKLVLTRKSKSNEAFSYRRWLLKRIIEKMSKNRVVLPFNLLENELNVCLITANSVQNNYHAWTHRIWCMEQFVLYYPNIVTRELEFSKEWIGQHVSENTGYHYRQFIIDLFKGCQNIPLHTEYFNEVIKQLNILNDGEAVQLIYYLLGTSTRNRPDDYLPQLINYLVLLLYELLVVIENINWTFKEHESLWLHRRYVLSSLFEVSHEYLGESFQVAKNINIPMNSTNANTKNVINLLVNENYGEKQPKMFKSQPNKFESTNLYKILSNTEKKFIGKNSSFSAFRLDLAKKHEKWLKYILGFELT